MFSKQPAHDIFRMGKRLCARVPVPKPMRRKKRLFPNVQHDRRVDFLLAQALRPIERAQGLRRLAERVRPCRLPSTV